MEKDAKLTGNKGYQREAAVRLGYEPHDFCNDCGADADKWLDNAVAADGDWRKYIRSYVLQIEKRLDVPGKFQGFSEPGANRQMSIYHVVVDIREYAKGDEGNFKVTTKRDMELFKMIAE